MIGLWFSLLLFIIYIGKIDKDSSFSSGVTFGECNVRRLMFANDLALLSSNKSDLQYALDWFSDAFLDAGMKISTTKTEIMCLLRHAVQCSFQTNGVTLKQTEKFKYLGVIFSSDSRQDNELDTRIGKASAVAPVLPIRCTETRAVYKSKAFCFQISFCFYPHL